jgi:plastocyanin
MKNSFKKVVSVLTFALSAHLSHSAIGDKFVYVSEIPGNIVSTGSGASMAGKICLINQDQRWTADKVYIVDKMVFVEEPAVLTIEAGTIVRFEANTKASGTSTNPSDPGAIFICRGAKIIARGTADAPIIMTNLDDPFVAGGADTIPTIGNSNGKGKEVSGVYAAFTPKNYRSAASSNTPRFSVDQEWGGLVILGKAKLAYGWGDDLGTDSTGSNMITPSVSLGASGKGVNFIEGTAALDGTVYGVTATSPYTFSGGLYGGFDDDDNSGSLRMVSIRFGGFQFATGNELNGLTTGALGRNTVIELVEIYNNADDDFEPFGGRNHYRYIGGFCGGDDGFDIDEGYNGNVQFFAQLQGNICFADGTLTGRISANEGDLLGEWDGPVGPNGGAINATRSSPYSVPTMFNATHIGMGNDGVDRKENTGGKVYNSIYVNPVNINFIGGTLTDAQNNIDGTGALHRLYITRGSGGQYNELGDTAGALEPDLFYKYTTFATRDGNAIVALSDSANVTLNDKVFDVNNFNQTLNYVTTTTVLRSLPFYTLSSVTKGVGNTGVGQLQNSPLVTPANTASYFGSLDPRTGTGVAAGIRPSQAGPAGYAAKSGWFVETDFRGAFKDGNWLSGWSVLEDVGVAPEGGFATSRFPTVTLKRVTSGDTLRVTFPTENGVKYSLQASEDGGKTFLPVHTATSGLVNGVVVGNGSAAQIDMPAKGSIAIQVRAMTL